jgi:hypothetical protein
VAPSPGDPLKVKADVTRQAQRRGEVSQDGKREQAERERARTQHITGCGTTNTRKETGNVSDAGRSCHECGDIPSFAEIMLRLYPLNPSVLHNMIPSSKGHSGTTTPAFTYLNSAPLSDTRVSPRVIVLIPDLKILNIKQHFTQNHKSKTRLPQVMRQPRVLNPKKEDRKGMKQELMLTLTLLAKCYYDDQMKVDAVRRTCARDGTSEKQMTERDQPVG